MSQKSNRSVAFGLCASALALLAGLALPASAQVVIHEIMQNPSAVGDSAGEWFEIHNPTGSAIDVEGWTIADNDVDSHLIANGGPLLVPAGGYLVLGNNDDSGTNGGVAVDYDYGGSFFLANGADELVLFDQTLTEIDRVEWDGGPAFPDPNGASMALVAPGLDNNVGANWCTSSTAFGSGDLGTPGAANDCPVVLPAIVIHEIMQNPSAVSDGSGEWFELHNAGGAAVDVEGWTVADNDFDSFVIANGGPLLIPAGGYLVLGNNDDSGTNGGVTVDYEYSGMFLSNGADELVLFDTLANEVDRVEWDGGPAFPDPNGASMALVAPGLDNGIGANWCTASTAFGDGDLGTPGAANDCVVAVPEIVINEIMQNPSAVGDSAGEWLEVYNPTGSAIDIDGWTLQDDDFDSHVITSGGPLLVPAGGFLVLGRNADSGSNGGVSVDYQYSGFFLGNGGDEVVLLDAFATEVDRVNYDGGPAFPDPNGASMALTSPLADNNVGGNWCTASTPYGAGDFGTPGAANDCPLPELVINEIMQNPSAVFDSNGEWLELFNPSGAPIDIDGWTLRDDDFDSHVITNGGPLLVPAGGYLVLGNNANAGTNGGVSVDYQYSGFFLSNGGDEVVLVDDLGNEIDRVGYDGGPAFPDPNGASMALAIPALDNNDGANWCTSTTPFGAGDDGTPGAVNDCPGIEIYEIQGSGAFSPFENLPVITRDNVVTGVRGNGFFIQTPAARDDFDAFTSNGIFVFTGGAPGVAEGDLVDVVGTVVEFFGFTEFDDDGLSVTVTGSGASQPAPILLDPANPDPGPFDPPDMERFEGMLVELAGGIATGPTDFFGDTAVTVGPARTYREPGIEFPSPFAGLPEWDGNQEVFEVDPDGLGLPDVNIFATQAVSAIGPLAFSFGDYQIWPKALILGPAPSVLDAVRARQPGEFTVGSFNLFRLNGGFAKLSAYVTDVLDSPDILAIQEVQDLGELEDLADQIALDSGVVYTASLLEGNDVGGIDVGFLTRENIQIDSLTQVDPDATFVNPVTMEDDILHDRPPLLLEGSCQLEFGSFPIAVMVVHNRSLGSIEDPVQGVRVRKKRFLQALSIAEKVDAMQTADPDIRLVVTGDFNAYEFTDGYVDAVGVITGDFVPADNLVCDTENCAGLPDNDLFDETLALPAGDRYSFIFSGNAQVLDHALTSVGISAEISGFEYGRGNADAYADLLSDATPANLPLRSSDHDGLVVYILKDEDDDGVPNDDDVCAGTVIPESVPTDGLGTNRHALVDGDGVFDTVAPGGGGSGVTYTLGDTAGCSCEQIIIAQGLGQGHVMHGCSGGEMQEWVDLVNP